MDKKQLQEIVSFIKENTDVNIGEVEIKNQDGSSVKVKLQASNHIMSNINENASNYGPASIPPASTMAAQTTQPTGHTVTSPMVGTAYLTPSPDAEPFIKIGKVINVGETICLVEAMKMFNKITADKTGVIKEILVTNGQAVDFDQPLVVIGDM